MTNTHSTFDLKWRIEVSKSIGKLQCICHFYSEPFVKKNFSINSPIDLKFIFKIPKIHIGKKIYSVWWNELTETDALRLINNLLEISNVLTHFWMLAFIIDIMKIVWRLAICIHRLDSSSKRQILGFLSSIWSWGWVNVSHNFLTKFTLNWSKMRKFNQDKLHRSFSIMCKNKCNFPTFPFFTTCKNHDITIELTHQCY